jgi:hypothetical protein
MKLVALRPGRRAIRPAVTAKAALPAHNIAVRRCHAGPRATWT